jgi:hypothetical protein
MEIIQTVRAELSEQSGRRSSFDLIISAPSFNYLA